MIGVTRSSQGAWLVFRREGVLWLHDRCLFPKKAIASAVNPPPSTTAQASFGRRYSGNTGDAPSCGFASGSAASWTADAATRNLERFKQKD